jgi:hypothetical protein
MKIQQWREWWSKARGNASVGTYDTREALVFDGWSAGWDAAEAQSQLEIMHLKAQLLRVGNHEGAYKAAFLAGQMSKTVKTFSGGEPNYVIPQETKGSAQVSPAEFIHIVEGKEDLTGNPIIWSQWPTKEKE